MLLRNYLFISNLTAMQLAKKTGLSVQTLYNLMSRERKVFPKPKILEAIEKETRYLVTHSDYRRLDTLDALKEDIEEFETFLEKL